MSAVNALLQCKNEENATLTKKYNDLQMQQTMLLAQCFSQMNAPFSNTSLGGIGGFRGPFSSMVPGATAGPTAS